MFCKPHPTPTPTGTFIGTLNGYKLYDDGVDGPLINCPVRKTNSSGISLQQNGKFTDLRWMGYTLATIAPLDDNPMSGISGTAINESSQVIGTYFNHNLPTSAQGETFIWINGVYTQLGSRSGTGGAPISLNDINNKGYYIGFNSPSAYVSNGNIFSTLLGLGHYTFPYCIDENNHIIGSSTDSEFKSHNVHWDPVTPPTDKNPLVPYIGEYFDNQTLTGTPKVVRLDPKINFIFDDNGSPDPLIPIDHFSARWTKTQFMSAGKYSFTLKSDDGIRFWVDNTLVIDDWTDHAMITYTPDITVNSGNHTFKVEYFENGGWAVAILNEDFPARNLLLPLPIPIPQL